MPARPSWLYYLFAVVMLAVAGYCLLLLALSASSRRRSGWDVELSHVAMGLAMAGMFVDGWRFGPNLMWELVFVALLVWFVLRAFLSVQRFGLHVPHTSVHAVMSLAMLLMYWFPMGASTSMSRAMSSAGGHVDPGLAFLVAFALFGSAVFTLASSRKGGAVYGTHVAVASPVLSGAGAGPSGADAAREAYLSGTPSDAGGLEGLVARPWLVDATHVVMCVAMGFMLVLTL